MMSSSAAQPNQPPNNQPPNNQPPPPSIQPPNRTPPNLSKQLTDQDAMEIMRSLYVTSAVSHAEYLIATMMANNAAAAMNAAPNGSREYFINREIQKEDSSQASFQLSESKRYYKDAQYYRNLLMTQGNAYDKKYVKGLDQWYTEKIRWLNANKNNYGVLNDFVKAAKL